MDTLVFNLSTETKDGKSKTIIDYELNGKKMSATFDPEKENEVDMVAKLFAKFNTDLLQEKKELKVGMVVAVTDHEKRYPNALAWAIDNLNQEELIEYGLGVTQAIYKGLKGRIVKIISLADKKVAAVRFKKDSYSFITFINLEGIEAV